MTSEIESLKATKVAQLKNEYNINVANLTKTYNNDVIIIRRSRWPLRNKTIATRILRMNYYKNLNNLKNKLNNDISNVEKMTSHNISIKNKKRALIVGINYTGTKYQLNGCINDAQNMQERCKNIGIENTLLLTDNTPIKPTKVNILNEFKNLLINSSSGDLLVFFYSGHGSYTADTNNDENDGRDEMIIPLDFNPILDDEFRNIIHNNLKKDVTLFALFDACHSGTVLDLKYQYYDSSNYDQFTINDKISETNGNVIMISGCADNQTSMDSYFNNKWQGALTWSFLECLKELEYSTWRELIKNMRDKLKNSNYQQIPQLSSGKLFDIDSKVFI
jgi:hypothetical protein